MGNVPVIHEVRTSLESLGDALTGDTNSARKRWHTYKEQSFFGSGVAALHAVCNGSEDEATRLAKGMARATGCILDTGLKIPILHEIGTCGRSLGNAMAGDTDSSRSDWDVYSNQSFFGSGVRAAERAAAGDWEGAQRFGVGMGVATAKGLIEAVSMAATVCTAGAAAAAVAPTAAVTAGAVTGGLVGAATGAGSNAAETALDGKPLHAGTIVGAALCGGVSGAIAGAVKGAKVRNAAGKSSAAQGAPSEAEVCSEAATVETAKSSLSDYSRPRYHSTRGLQKRTIFDASGTEIRRIDYFHERNTGHGAIPPGVPHEHRYAYHYHELPFEGFRVNRREYVTVYNGD